MVFRNAIPQNELAGEESNAVVKPSEIWSKTTRFEDEVSPRARNDKNKSDDNKLDPTIRSNEHLEALESCL